MFRTCASAFGLLLCLSSSLSALATQEEQEEQGEQEELTLERIMAHPDWMGNAPEQPYWSDDSETVYFQRKRQGEPLRDLYRVARSGGRPERVPDEERGRVSAPGGELSPDRTLKAFTRAGDLFVRSLPSGDVRQLTRTRAQERAIGFTQDGGGVIFQRDDKLYVRELTSGLEWQAADLRTAEDPAEADEPEGFLEEAELRLLEILQLEQREDRQRRERQRALAQADPTRLAPPIYLGDETRVLRRTLSPNGEWMLLVAAQGKRDEGRKDRMPNYISDEAYVDVRDVRAKVGTAQPIDHQLIWVDLETGSQRTLEWGGEIEGLSDDPLAFLQDAPEDEGAEEKEAAEEGADDPQENEPKPRPVSIESLSFAPNGELAALQLHSYDNKDRWILLVARDGTHRVLHRLNHDEGWINWYYNQMGWLPGSDGLWFLSEESGYSQLYVHDLGEEPARQLTRGSFVVSSVELDPSGEQFYFTANREHPGHYNVHRIPVAGGQQERVTRLGGLTSFQLSPDGSWLLLSQSSLDRPTELFVQAADPQGIPNRITNTVSAEFRAVAWTVPEIVPVPSSHVESPIYSRLYLPSEGAPRLGADGKRPAVVFVHGAGYLQNAHYGWSGYFREFMFHTLLTRAGFVVLDMDYRASRGYGRDWRAAIYRQMGHPEVEDLEDGVAYLAAEHGVDPQRVGVYGGSYGGFLTFMALFRRPELFASGAALRPVTDWAHYNHSYTSNILNTPKVDPEAYRKSSPIEYAEGLAKPLLICAGMQDDNVFFQDTVRLVQVLIEKGKTDFETAFYPIEPHGFVQPSSWLDEYRRIYALFDRTL